MSEPQTKPVKDLMNSTEEEAVQAEEQVPITVAPTTATPPPTATETPESQPPLTGHVKTLKDAFPDLDVEVIETILDSQGGNLDAAFEILLGMSDPTYKPEPQQTEGLDQLRQDEEYARRLAREGDAHYPQNNANHHQQQQQQDQPLFNFQEELPIIKEKVIEAGNAAKTKIMSLYNQFIAGPSNEQQQQGGVLEAGMGNLSLSDNQQPQQQRGRSVDLYEWDGQQHQQAEAPVRNPLLRKQSVTSTSVEQILSDEEFARQLAREDAEVSALAASPVQNTYAAPVNTKSASIEAVKSSADSDDHGEVSLTAVDSSVKPSGYTIAQDDDDDLDDLFDKNDSNTELKVEAQGDKPTTAADKTK